MSPAACRSNPLIGAYARHEQLEMPPLARHPSAIAARYRPRPNDHRLPSSHPKVHGVQATRERWADSAPGGVCGQLPVGSPIPTTSTWLGWPPGAESKGLMRNISYAECYSVPGEEMFYAKNWPFRNGPNMGTRPRAGVVHFGLMRDENGRGFLVMSVGSPRLDWEGSFQDKNKLSTFGEPLCAQ